MRQFLVEVMSRSRAFVSYESDKRTPDWRSVLVQMTSVTLQKKKTLPEYFIIIEIAMIFARPNDGYSLLCV